MDVLSIWKKCQKYPCGSFIFSKLLAHRAPYTGSISPTIHKLEAGLAVVSMTEKRSLQNHLNSLHAIALMNLAELSTGLALMTSVPTNARAIIKGLSIDFVKKARGKIIAEASQSPIHSNEKQEYVINSVLKNEAGEVVCTAKASWIVGPK